MNDLNISCEEQIACFPGDFTVLMSVYKLDSPDLFVRAVRSVYENTLTPNSFILIVDGQVGPSLNDAIQQLQTEFPIEIIRLSSNVGLANALNIGLSKIKTNWVVRADSDDYNLPNRFALQALAIQNNKNDIDIIGGAILEIDEYGKQLSVRRTPEHHSDIQSFAAYRNPFNHMTVAYKVSVALSCGGYPNIYLKEDYALWARMLASGSKCRNLSDILVHATAGKEMYIRRGGLKYALAEVSLQHSLVQLGLKNPFSAILQGSMRALVFILPSTLRGWIYRNLLRKPL